MTKADKMFEKLGYDKVEENESNVFYEKGSNAMGNIWYGSIRRIEITMNKNKKVFIEVIDNRGNERHTDIFYGEEILAVTEKCKELGWTE